MKDISQAVCGNSNLHGLRVHARLDQTRALILRLTRHALRLTLAVGASTACAAYPDRPIRLVVPVAPGGAVDVVGRIMAQKMADALEMTPEDALKVAKVESRVRVPLADTTEALQVSYFGAGVGGTIIGFGATLVATFERDRIDARGSYEVVVSEAGRELTRAGVDMARLR